jgi:outer membrane protein assembly factor BamB
MKKENCETWLARGIAALFSAAFLLVAACGVARAAESWPQFRGPNCSGVAETAKPPTTIGTNQGVHWMTEVPWSPGSPSVWADSIFLTTYSNGELQTRAYSRRNGKLLWTRGIKPGQLEMYHSTESSPATATPATDGRRVVSYFGSFGLVCYDFKGKEIWRHELPLAISGGGFGSGTSPALVGNLIVLNRDQDGGKSSLLAVDLATGKTVWEAPRPDAIGSFGTPIVWNSGMEIVMPGTLQLKGYDLKTGHERWVVNGMVGFACTTPVAGDGLLFFAAWSPGQSDSPWSTWEAFLEKYDKNHDGEISLADEIDSGSREFMRGLDRDHDGKITRKDWDQIKERATKARNILVAVKPGGEGDITETHVAWSATRGLPYVPSPLLYQGRLYLIKDGGMMSCFDAKTGQPFYSQERLEANDKYYSSPVAADGRIYVASLAGKVTVIKAGGDKPEVLHQANFGERIFATPAPVGKNLYLRTATKLYAF